MQFKYIRILNDSTIQQFFWKIKQIAHPKVFKLDSSITFKLYWNVLLINNKELLEFKQIWDLTITSFYQIDFRLCSELLDKKLQLNHHEYKGKPLPKPLGSGFNNSIN